MTLQGIKIQDVDKRNAYKSNTYTGGVHPKLVAAPPWKVNLIAVPLPNIPRPAIDNDARNKTKLNALKCHQPENSPYRKSQQSVPRE